MCDWFEWLYKSCTPTRPTTRTTTTNSPQLPHLISNLPITPITSSSSTPELDVVETKLVLNDVLKEFNNGKILCLSKDDDDGEDNEK